MDFDAIETGFVYSVRRSGSVRLRMLLDFGNGKRARGEASSQRSGERAYQVVLGVLKLDLGGVRRVSESPQLEVNIRALGVHWFNDLTIINQTFC